MGMESVSGHPREACDALSDKEKETLRLIVRGHDAKSSARALGLSVHTINERLRAARRKLSVSSSREAARLLDEAERAAMPDAAAENAVSRQLGDDRAAPHGDTDGPPAIAARPPKRALAALTGAIIMAFFIAALLLSAPAEVQQPPAAPTAAAPATASASLVRGEVVRAALDWLALVDRGDWAASHAATGTAFRALNTVQVWTDASQVARVPLGAAVSRTAISQQSVPTPPAGHEVLTFRTSFANKAHATETVSLTREDGAWRVVGYIIE